MGLKEKIKDFNLRDNEGIDKDDNNGKISEAFKPIAETILSGHFKVTKNNSDSYVTVHPTCVEMYYHEEGEGEDKIKWKSHATLTLLANQDLPTFGYNMIDPLKPWCWGSILFYPFKISRFS